MVKLEDIKRFINNDFEKAILYGYKGNKFSLLLEGKSKINYQTISNYGKDLDKMNEVEIANYLLDSFLNNNNIIKNDYFVSIPKHFEKLGIVLASINKQLLIVMDKKTNINEIFPDFVKKIEQNKQRSIIEYVNSLDEINNFYFNQNTFYKSGLRCYDDASLSYNPLYICDKKNNLILYKNELEFCKQLLKMIIYKKELNQFNYSFKIGEVFNLLGFHYHIFEDIDLNILSSVLNEIKNENKENGKQLVLEGMYANNGKNGEFL